MNVSDLGSMDHPNDRHCLAGGGTVVTMPPRGDIGESLSLRAANRYWAYASGCLYRELNRHGDPLF
jgi:hypothetical protein